MPRALDYAILIGRHVTMHIGGKSEDEDESLISGDVTSVMDWDDGSAVEVTFADGRRVDIKAEDSDQWRMWIR
jgi:hypothetical protein